nr:putative ribonuclease H-like domain-containing protein [Tanacetum cinerariifolium]
VLTKSIIVPISIARQSSSRAGTPVSAVRPITTATPKPLVNVAKPRQNALQKSHSLSRGPFYQQTALKNRNLNNTINTTKVNSVNAAKGNRVTSIVGKQGINVVKSSHAGFGDLKFRSISYLTDFKEHDGGYVAFGGGAKGGKITGKGTIRTADESHVLLKVPRKNNMYNFDMKNIVPQKDLTCLLAKVTNDESMLWHRRLGHINKILLPPFSWVFFLATKDETSRILKSFMTETENLVDKKVKIIRCDNGTEFKNRVMNYICEEKGIKREYSMARTPQQNGVAERRNRTLIELTLDEESAQKLHVEELAKETARKEQEMYNLKKDLELQKQLDQREEDKLDKKTEEEVEAQADTDQEIEEMKLYVKIVPDEDIAIDAIPLATKPLVIVEYKIVKEGKNSTYHIIKADGSTKRYTSMIKLLENIDREDLETLWKLVKDKHGNTRPEEDCERVLWGDIKVMFESDIESEVWSNYSIMM